jgi:hypothetical protein
MGFHLGLSEGWRRAYGRVKLSVSPERASTITSPTNGTGPPAASSGVRDIEVGGGSGWAELTEELLSKVEALPAAELAIAFLECDKFGGRQSAAPPLFG